MHSRLILKTARRGITGPSRPFCTTAVCEDKPILNRYSRTVTQTKDQGASQVVGLGLIYKGATNLKHYPRVSRLCCMPLRALRAMKTSTRPWLESQVCGESTINFASKTCGSSYFPGMRATRESNIIVLLYLCHAESLAFVSRCNRHLLGLGQKIKKSLYDADVIGYQFGTVGVSDGISMGTRGMSFSLQSRDLIADQVETAAGGHWLDGMVVVPGCDKNMPGVLMARACFPPPFSSVYREFPSQLEG